MKDFWFENIATIAMGATLLSAIIGGLIGAILPHYFEQKKIIKQKKQTELENINLSTRYVDRFINRVNNFLSLDKYTDNNPNDLKEDMIVRNLGTVVKKKEFDDLYEKIFNAEWIMPEEESVLSGFQKIIENLDQFRVYTYQIDNSSEYDRNTFNHHVNLYKKFNKLVDEIKEANDEIKKFKGEK